MLAHLERKGEKPLANEPINDKRKLSILINPCREKPRVSKTRVNRLQSPAPALQRRKPPSARADDAQLLPKRQRRRIEKIWLEEQRRFQRLHRRSRTARLVNFQRKKFVSGHTLFPNDGADLHWPATLIPTGLKRGDSCWPRGVAELEI